MKTELRTVLLLTYYANFTLADIESYADLGIHGLGLGKGLLVKKDENGHIDQTNTEAVDKVINGQIK